jgi:hypothetical protein
MAMAAMITTTMVATAAAAIPPTAAAGRNEVAAPKSSIAIEENENIAVASADPASTVPSVLASARPTSPAPTAVPTNASALTTCLDRIAPSASWSRRSATSASPHLTNWSNDGCLSLQPSRAKHRYCGKHQLSAVLSNAGVEMLPLYSL